MGDVTTLATLADSVMILCCPDRTRSKPIRHATRHLTEAGATILGVIVNDVDMSSGSAFLPTSRSYGYGYGGYSGYGYRGYGAYRPRTGGKSSASKPEAGKGSSAKPDDAAKPAQAGGGEKSAATDADKGGERRHLRRESLDIADDD